MRLIVRKMGSPSVHQVCLIPWWSCPSVRYAIFSGAFSWSFCPLAWTPSSEVSQLCSQHSTSRKRKRLVARCWLQSAHLWCFETGQTQKFARTGWFALKRVFRDVAHVCAFSNGFVQPLVCPGNNSWHCHQGRDHIAKERCLGGTRRLQAHNFTKSRVKDFGEPLRSDRTRTELRCEGKIDPEQFALGTQGPRRNRRRYRSLPDQFRLA